MSKTISNGIKFRELEEGMLLSCETKTVHKKYVEGFLQIAKLATGRIYSIVDHKGMYLWNIGDSEGFMTDHSNLKILDRPVIQEKDKSLVPFKYAS